MLRRTQTQPASKTMLRAILRCLPALAIAVLMGCAAAPVPKATQELPASWQATPAVVISPAVDLQSWWTVFNAPELNTLVAQTLSQNLKLAEAQQRIRSARLLSNTSGYAFRPELHARTDDIPAPSSVATYFRYGFDATWELGLFGRGESTKRVAKGELDQAEADNQAIRVSVVAEVVRAWVDLRNAQQHRDLLVALAAKNQARVSLLQQRANLGLALPDALLKARLAQSKAQSLLLEQNNQVEQALRTLATLQGKTVADPAWAQTSSTNAPDAIALPSLPTDLLRTRPDIQHAQASVLMAAGELGIARSEMYPHITLTAEYMYSAATSGSLRFNDRVNAAASIGPVIDIPLFDWGRRKTAKKARAALLDAALFGYRDTVIQAYADTESALSALTLQNQRLVHAADQLAITSQAQHSRQQLTGLGLASPLDNLEDDSSTLQARLDQLDTLASRDYAYISVFKALGGAALAQANVPSQAVTGVQK